MKVVIPANGVDLDAPTSPIFGRCETFVFVDSDTLEVEAVSNVGKEARGGAGVQAAQLVLDRGAEAVVARRLGPNAFRLIQSADVPVYVLNGATVREAIQNFQAKRLTRL